MIPAQSAAGGGATGGRVDATVDARDEVELPGAAMDLPSAQRQQAADRQHRGARENEEREPRAPARLRTGLPPVGSLENAHGMLRMPSGDMCPPSGAIGIMLELR